MYVQGRLLLRWMTDAGVCDWEQEDFSSNIATSAHEHKRQGQECVQPQSFRVRVRVSHYVFSLTKTAERPYAYIVKKANVSALLRLGLS